jgi:cyanate permease
MQPPRQLSIAFETPALLGLAADQRATVIQALTVMLLQAAGVHLTEDDDVER